MKTQEMRELTAEQLQEQVTTARKELFEFRLKKTENTAQLGALKNRIARLKTVQREKELAAASK